MNRRMPVQWQYVDEETGTVSRSKVHLVSSPDLTVCGQGVPKGAWAGPSVQDTAIDRHKCPRCWEAGANG